MRIPDVLNYVRQRLRRARMQCDSAHSLRVPGLYHPGVALARAISRRVNSPGITFPDEFTITLADVVKWCAPGPEEIILEHDMNFVQIPTGEKRISISADRMWEGIIADLKKRPQPVVIPMSEEDATFPPARRLRASISATVTLQEDREVRIRLARPEKETWIKGIGDESIERT